MNLQKKYWLLFTLNREASQHFYTNLYLVKPAASQVARLMPHY